MKLFDRSQLTFYPLAQRVNRLTIADLKDVPAPLETTLEQVQPLADAIRASRTREAGRVLAFGAHTIKNGMGPVISSLITGGWITHCATNGAGIIHDWELAYQGETSEHVRENVAHGTFGMWEETVRMLNLAIDLGAYRGWGYGEAIGHLVEESGLNFPDREELDEAQAGNNFDVAAAAVDLKGVMNRLDIPSGFLPVHHAHPEFGLQAAALRADLPFTAHPMFGHDIIYTHPACCGAAIGRTADRDFLRFAASITTLNRGVYISVGSAVMSPMIFEKSLSMARNAAAAGGTNIDDFDLFVVDLADMQWDWEKEGEPPADDPAYYVRFCKSFSRMGGRFHYLRLDARELFPALQKLLN